MPAVEHGRVHDFSRTLGMVVFPEAKFVAVGVAEKSEPAAFFLLDLAGRDAALMHLLQRLLKLRDRKAEPGIATAGHHNSGRPRHQFDEHPIKIEARDVIPRNHLQPKHVAIERDRRLHVGDVIKDSVERKFQLTRRR